MSKELSQKNTTELNANYKNQNEAARKVSQQEDLQTQSNEDQEENLRKEEWLPTLQQNEGQIEWIKRKIAIYESDSEDEQEVFQVQKKLISGFYEPKFEKDEKVSDEQINQGLVDNEN